MRNGCHVGLLGLIRRGLKQSSTLAWNLEYQLVSQSISQPIRKAARKGGVTASRNLRRLPFWRAASVAVRSGCRSCESIYAAKNFPQGMEQQNRILKLQNATRVWLLAVLNISPLPLKWAISRRALQIEDCFSVASYLLGVSWLQIHNCHKKNEWGHLWPHCTHIYSSLVSICDYFIGCL